MERQDKKPTTKGPADWFTGDVWVDQVAQGHGPTPTTIGLVHFTPGARTAWHAHEVAQTLYVTEGEGCVQARGENRWPPFAPVTSSLLRAASGTGTVPPQTTS